MKRVAHGELFFLMTVNQSAAGGLVRVQPGELFSNATLFELVA